MYTKRRGVKTNVSSHRNPIYGTAVSFKQLVSAERALSTPVKLPRCSQRAFFPEAILLTTFSTEPTTAAAPTVRGHAVKISRLLSPRKFADAIWRPARTTGRFSRGKRKELLAL